MRHVHRKRYATDQNAKVSSLDIFQERYGDRFQLTGPKVESGRDMIYVFETRDQ
jgi:hypothetical protein